LKLAIENIWVEVLRPSAFARAKVAVVLDIMGSALMAIGSGLVIVASRFDFFMRLRIVFIVGDRRAFWRGPNWGIYSQYRAAGKLNGWATWPVSAMWAFLAFGVAVFVVGVIAIHNGSK
jgi:hypothetical protein